MRIKIIFLIFCIFIISVPANADIISPFDVRKEYYINKQGHLIFPSSKDKSNINSHNKIRLQVKNISPHYSQETKKWGFIDIKNPNEWVIEPKFDQASFFNDGLAAVKINNNWGFVDEKGDLVIEPKFPALICDTGFGKQPYCSSNTVFSEGLAPVKYEKKEFVRVDGDKYEAVYDFEKGDENVLWQDTVYGRIKDDKFYIVLQEKLVPQEYNEKTIYTNEDLTVETADLQKSLTRGHLFCKFKTGYIDKSGNVVFDTSQYCQVFPFSDGFAKVQKGIMGNYGYIDKNGNEVIKPRFKYATDFVNGIAEVSVDLSMIWLIPLFAIILAILYLPLLAVKIVKNNKR